MGSCFSSSSSTTTATADQPPTAKVVNSHGSLIEFSQPVEVSHVLGLNHQSFFLCNADALLYGHHIQALDANHLIQLGNIYFILPAEKLNHPLMAAEMAAMAVSANSALADAALMKKKKKKSVMGRMRREGVQVMPVVTVMECDEYESFNESGVGSWKIEKDGRKSDHELKQRALRRRESAVKKTFRPRLSTIEEIYE